MCVGTTALVAISSETRCWLQRPATQEQAYRYQGEERVKRHRRPTASAPQSVAALAATLPAWQWYGRKVSHSIALCGGTCPRSAKASRGEDLDIEKPVACWDCSTLHFYPTLTGVLGASLIRYQIVEMR